MILEYINDLMGLSLFHNMTKDDVINTLEHMSTEIKTYKINHYICKQNGKFNSLGIILSGKASMERFCSSTGTSAKYSLTKMSTFGVELVSSNISISPYTIKAMQKTMVLYIHLNYNKFFSTNKNNYRYLSKFYINLLNVLSSNIIDLNKQMDYIRIVSIKKRLVKFLLDNRKNEDAYVFSIDMSQEQIANYLNISMRTITKLLPKLKENGIIDYHRSFFKILDVERLSEFAQKPNELGTSA
ncbi:MAG: Crp/Fnr family transcriptional regulator [Clostridia bacterium]|nr:Crp/Fnr family transcriptional regulator [Clostridia bacterium]